MNPPPTYAKEEKPTQLFRDDHLGFWFILTTEPQQFHALCGQITHQSVVLT